MLLVLLLDLELHNRLDHRLHRLMLNQLLNQQHHWLTQLTHLLSQLLD